MLLSPIWHERSHAQRAPTSKDVFSAIKAQKGHNVSCELSVSGACVSCAHSDRTLYILPHGTCSVLPDSKCLTASVPTLRTGRPLALDTAAFLAAPRRASTSAEQFICRHRRPTPAREVGGGAPSPPPPRPRLSPQPSPTPPASHLPPPPPRSPRTRRSLGLYLP